jgi:CRP-like cAMP-binding protein
LDERGDFFGEMALIDILPRSATVYASGETRILAFPKQVLTTLFSRVPRVQMPLVLNIARNLSLRLRQAGTLIVSFRAEVEKWKQKSMSESTLLRDSPLFRSLEGAEIIRLVELSEIQEYSPGETVVVEGSMGDAIFLLYDGELSVRTLDNGGRDITLAQVNSQGAFFGEVAIADPGTRSAAVRAYGESVSLMLSLEALEVFWGEFANAQVVILRNIARVLAQRLRESNVLVASIASNSSSV